jgi:branched-chain amino acid transport system ATP-binding protein
VSVLRVEEVHTYYGDSHILQGVSLQAAPGTIVALLGRNGAGKTTLVRSAMGFLRPRRGRVVLGEVDITHWRPYRIARLGMSLVPQGRQIFPSLDVTETLMIGWRPRRDGWALDKVYDLFPPLRERAHHPSAQLSGGEQQMLAIGRALMMNPSTLLLDEPTEGLSPLYVETVGQAIRTLRDRGLAMLLVEQNLKFAIRYADHVHIMSRGAIVHSAPPAALVADDEVRSRYLGV